MNEKDDSRPETCPVFGVRSGAPIIGLGILLILFGLIPLGLGGNPVSVPIIGIFIGFGIFLIWAGLTK